MPKDNHKRVLSLLCTLDAAELEDVINRAKAYRNMACADMRDWAKTDGMIILECIADTMGSMGLDGTSADRLAKTPHYKEFVPKCGDLMQWVRAHTCTQNQERALLRMGVKLMAENLQKANWEVNSRIIARHIHRLPGIVNMAFPGYASNGMLKLMLGDQNART